MQRKDKAKGLPHPLLLRAVVPMLMSECSVQRDHLKMAGIEAVMGESLALPACVVVCCHTPCLIVLMHVVLTFVVTLPD